MRAIHRIAFVALLATGCNLFQPSERPTGPGDAGPALDMSADVVEDAQASDAIIAEDATAQDIGPGLSDATTDDAGTMDMSDTGVDADLSKVLPPALIAYDFESVLAGQVPDVSQDGAYPLSFAGLVEIGNGYATFEGGALTSAAPTAFYDAVAVTESFAVSLWLRTSQLQQGQLDDEATSKRLITFSLNSGARDFTVAQLDDNVMLRLNTTGNSPNGTPSTRIDNAFDGQLQHHFVQVEPNRMRYWIDGAVVFDGWPGGTLDWSVYDMMLGGEFQSDRIWAGELHDVRIWADAFDDDTIAEIHAYGVPAAGTP